MDELTTLATMRDDLPDPTPQALAGARVRLTDRMNSAGGPRTVPSRRWYTTLRWRLTAGLTTAAALAAGVGIAVVAGTGGAPPARSGGGMPATTAAVTALDLAADHTTRTGDPTVGHGQYRHVVTQGWYAERVGGIRFQERSRREVWVPAGGKGTWYWRETDGLANRFSSAADRRRMKARHPEVFTPNTSVASGHAGRQDKAATDGPQPSAPPTQVRPDWDFPTPAWLARQPTNPDALLSAIEGAQPSPAPGTRPKGDPPTLAFNRIATTLSSGIVPADLRAAMYKVLTRLPGVKLVSRTATIDGRSGVAVGRLEPGGHLRQEIIFDSVAGRFIGEREVAVDRGATWAHLPAGATYTSTSMTVDVTGRPHLPGL